MTEKEVHLNIVERIHLYGILPKEGNIATMKSIKTLRESLGFSDQENKDWEIKVSTENIAWNPSKVAEKRFIFSEMQLDVMTKEFERLDKEKKLTLETLAIYEKILE